MTNTDRARELLTAMPMTRYALQGSLRLTQQRTSEILKLIGAEVVGHERQHGANRPSPIYGFCGMVSSDPMKTAAVSFVFDLGMT